MVRRLTRMVVASLVGAVPLYVQAQQQPPDSLRATTIEVIQSYKPEMKQVPRPQLTPELPPRDTSRPKLSYEVPQQTLYFTYSALPLRPLALGRDTVILPYSSYVKLGGGNFSTIYLDAGIAALKGRNWETALHLHHLSQSGNIKYQKVSLSGFEGEGTVRANNHRWRLSASGLMNRYYNYGYDHRVYEYSQSELRQTFTGFSAGVDVKNDSLNSIGISYHPSVQASFYSDERDVSETTISFDAPVSKHFDEHMSIGIGVNGTLTNLSVPGESIATNILRITPHFRYEGKSFQVRLGLYPAFGSRIEGQLLPDIEISYKLPNTYFFMGAGWQSKLVQNSYKELTTYNPYLGQGYLPGVISRVDEAFGMLGFNLGSHVTLTGKVAWMQFDMLPLFLNDTGDHKMFYVVYAERVRAALLEGTARYDVANDFSLGLTARYYNYYESPYSRVWHEPALRVKGDFRYRPFGQLEVHAYATIMDQIYTLNAAQQVIKLDAVFDVGGGVEYTFTPRISGFLQVNNILNNEYQRWYKYQAYGLNLFGGVRFKF